MKYSFEELKMWDAIRNLIKDLGAIFYDSKFRNYAFNAIDLGYITQVQFENLQNKVTLFDCENLFVYSVS